MSLYKYLIFLTLLASGSLACRAQDSLSVEEPEKKEKKPWQPLRLTGIRFGTDITVPVYALLEEEYFRVEGNLDIGINHKYFLVADLGLADLTRDQTNASRDYEYRLTGSYLRLGFDWNALNKRSPDAQALFGLRYGLAVFEHSTRYAYTDPYWGEQSRRLSETGIRGQWVEAVAGFKARMFGQFYVSSYARLKFLVQADGGGSGALEVNDVPGYGPNNGNDKQEWNLQILYRIPLRKEGGSKKAK